MAERTGVRCGFCGAEGLRVDEHGHCEQCMLDQDYVGSKLDDLEGSVRTALVSGLTAAQVQQAFEMSLSGTEGPLPGTLLRREAVETSEGAVWFGPPSLFTDDDISLEDQPNQIAWARRVCGLSLETLAAMVGVTPCELALWEHGALPPRRHARALADRFGLALDSMLRCSHGPEADSFVCNRCGRPAPNHPQRYEQGWDVAGGTELICSGCLTTDDLIWPSDAPVREDA